MALAAELSDGRIEIIQIPQSAAEAIIAECLVRNLEHGSWNVISVQ